MVYAIKKNLKFLMNLDNNLISSFQLFEVQEIKRQY